MKIEWLVLCEALAQDSRGAVTVIGLNQNAFVTPTLPASTNRALVAHITGVTEGQNLAITLSARDPEGNVIAALTGNATVGRQRYPDLPVMIDINSQMAILVHAYGTHAIQATVNDGSGKPQSAEIDLYVIEGNSA